MTSTPDKYWVDKDVLSQEEIEGLLIACIKRIGSNNCVYIAFKNVGYMYITRYNDGYSVKDNNQLTDTFRSPEYITSLIAMRRQRVSFISFDCITIYDKFSKGIVPSKGNKITTVVDGTEYVSISNPPNDEKVLISTTGLFGTIKHGVRERFFILSTDSIFIRHGSPLEVTYWINDKEITVDEYRDLIYNLLLYSGNIIRDLGDIVCDYANLVN
jgi:hypothetical protein